jgi:hypothetical protein
LWALFSVLLFVCFYVATMLFWISYLCRKFWNEIMWWFQLYSFWSKLSSDFGSLMILYKF